MAEQCRKVSAMKHDAAARSRDCVRRNTPSDTDDDDDDETSYEAHHELLADQVSKFLCLERYRQKPLLRLFGVHLALTAYQILRSSASRPSHNIRLHHFLHVRRREYLQHFTHRMDQGQLQFSHFQLHAVGVRVAKVG